jgi:anti-anti-sigma factor
MVEQSMSTRLVHRNGVTVLAVDGEVDMSVKDDFLGALDAAIHATAIHATDRVLFIDLAALQFLDSSGCHCLVVAAEDARTRGVTFQVTNPSPRVARVLNMTGLDVMLGVESTAS